MKPLKKYLEQNGLTIYRLSKNSGLAFSTLSKATNRDSIDSTTFRILRAIAKSVNKSVGQVADELEELDKQKDTH